MSRTGMARLALLTALLASTAFADAGDYVPGDEGFRPRGGTQILPEAYLRGFDPITVYFHDRVGPGEGDADDGAKRMRILPPWPGAYHWADARTLQFRPAEPWPPLARFAVEAGGAQKILTTMMSAPSAMSPAAGANDLAPFRTLTITFPQALPVESLRRMLTLELRDLPGLADSPRRRLSGWNLAELPRASAADPATYAITLDADVPEGKLLQVTVSLGLGQQDKVLWTGQVSTQLPFHLQSVQCGASQYPLAGAAQVSKALALACGSQGEQPQLVFSAPVADLGLTALKQLVRLDPSVPDLHFQLFGSRVQLQGRFAPDTLYRMRLGGAAVHDQAGRSLQDPGAVELYFYLGRKSPFLRWSQASAIVEARGPQMVPLVGYGDSRADVRIYRIDPLFAGLWPFPDNPVAVTEQSAPPFPGEEPAPIADPQQEVDAQVLQANLRLLGSPLVSKVVELPRDVGEGPTRFGLDLAPLLMPVEGANQPGTYLVGVRRLAGAPERSYLRVQVTNLSLTTVEDRDRAVFFVRALDSGEPVADATVTLEGLRRNWAPDHKSFTAVAAQVSARTDSAGKAELLPVHDWTELRRLSVKSGDDVLVLDPREPPPQFAANHWGIAGGWLSWLTAPVPPPVNDKLLGFIFTERPIYRPGEPVFIKGYLRQKRGGALVDPGEAKLYALEVDGPDNQSWALPLSFTALDGFSATFDQKNLATGDYTAKVLVKKTGEEVASRPFRIDAYRIPKFEVRLSGPVAARLDQPFQVKAIARYYAGGEVSGQPIAWTVLQRPYHHVPEGRAGFLFASSDQFARPQSSKPPETITRQAVLSASGSDSITINPALDIDGSARTYVVEATVTGADDQPVTAVEKYRALPPFTLGLKVPRYLEHASEISPQVIAVGPDDKLLAGQSVRVRLYRRIWNSQLRETNFSTGKARYVTEQHDVKMAEVELTSKAQPITTTFPIKDAGVYVIELSGRDKLGRTQVISADLYVGGAKPLAWPKPREGVFQLRASAPSFAPGQTAKVLIESPFQTAHALVITEVPGGNRYDWIDVRGGKAVFPISITAAFTPNLPVHVVLMRGRLPARRDVGDGTDRDDSRYRPQTVAATLELEIRPVKNQLQVKVAHPDSARPGTTVNFTLSLADDQNRPVGGEVTLWLVDEAVLSLAKEGSLDPLDAFVVRNRQVSSLRDTRNLIIGELLEQPEDPGGDGDGQGETATGSVAHTVRKNFKTVPYYQATLTVPPSGKLVVPITLSDDLTNFSVRAVAASGMSRFGLDQSTLHVRLPVIVQPQLPRFVRQGDKLEAGGIARLLEGSAGSAVVDVAIGGPAKVQGPAHRTVSLERNTPVNVLVPITVGNVPAGTLASLTVKMNVTRKSDGVGDAFEVKIPVLPDRAVENVATLLRWKPGAVKLPALSEAARAGTLQRSVLISEVPGVLALAAGLDYLGQYPHGCLEQQLSQLYPEIVQGNVLRKLGLDSGPAHAGAEAHLSKFLASLPQYQDEQGLFSFWPGGEGDVQLTAELADFLGEAKRDGYPVDAQIQSRALDAMNRALRSDYPRLLADFRYDQQTEAIRTLARAGRLDEHFLLALFEHRGEMDPSSLAALAEAMSGKPKLFGPDLQTLRGALWDTLVFQLRGGKTVLDHLHGQRADWRNYLGDDTATLASVFQSLVELDPTNSRLTPVREALVASADPVRGWGNTYDNRHAVAALATYLSQAQIPGAPTQLVLDGTTLHLDSHHAVARLDLDHDAPGTAVLSGAAVEARVADRYLPAVSGDRVAARAKGFLVSRGATLIHADGRPDETFEDASGKTRALSIGDILELHTRLVTDQTRYHVALVVPFAAGLEPMNPALANEGAKAKPSQADSIEPSSVQRLDSEVRYYFDELPKGSYSFHFRVRAATAGSFVHPPPHAELMYREEVSGRGDGMRLVISRAH